MCKTATNPDGLVKSIHLKLQHLVDGLFHSFGKDSRPLPELPTLGEVRDFCEGISVKPGLHPWIGLKEELTRRQFQTLSHSLFLFRKVIPKPFDKELPKKYIRTMMAASPPTSAAFISYVRKEMRNILTPGWDRGYKRKVESLTLSTSGCSEGKRAKGGARSCNGSLDQIKRYAKGVDVLEKPDLKATVSVVRENGKDRVVTISSVEQFALRPLHDQLYECLRSKEWLLDGDARTKRFSDFVMKEGEFFISGDYESATDNINIDLYEEILECIYRYSDNVPWSVYELAKKRARLNLDYRGYCRRQRRGQLMGNFLSFPILCIINYLTFKYNVPRHVPVRINGDDIVFRGTMEEYNDWRKGVAVSGLKISEGKTSVDSRYFTLNSALFKGGKNKVGVVPYIRSKALFNTPEDASALVGQYKSICPGFSGPAAGFFRILYLRSNKKMIGLTQRSLSRGLGMYVTVSILRQSGLARREKFYLSMPDETQLPGSDPIARITLSPEGYAPTRKTNETREEWKVLREVARSYGHACRLYAQLAPREVEQLSKKRMVQRFVERLQKGTRSFRDLEGRFFDWLTIGSDDKTRPSWRVHVPRTLPEVLLLPRSENRFMRPGLGYRQNVLDLV